MTLIVGFQPGRDDNCGLEFAATLSRSSGQDLLVVTVVPAPWPTPMAGGTDREFADWARQQGAAAVAEAESMLADHCPELPARAIAVPGRSVPSTLIAQAEEHNAEMIVVSSGHGGSYGHINVTSTADSLLHASPVPVGLATRGYFASEHGKVSRATCAFRGDPASRRTLGRTARICAEVGAGLRVATFAVRGKTMYPPEVGTQAEDMILEAWVAQATAAQESAIAELKAEDGLPDDVESIVAVGRNWGVAVDRLEWERDEVLVIGSSASSAVSRLFLGSSASKIVRHSPVPVIVVP